MAHTLSSFFAVFFIVSLAFGGSTGKIAGIVKDKNSGEPIIGANVRLEGTNFGGATDFDGKYFIINLPPNDYVLYVTIVGYTPSKITDVRVRGDLTTTIDVELSETVLQVGQEVVVVAERPLVQKDLTAKTAIVSGKEISSLPVTEVGAVVSLQAGFVGGNLRGGRTGEVAYWIDGVPVTDAFDGSQIVEVNKSLVQELQVISGAFNAEYGQAMSGIVNISAKEGGAKYTGGIGVYGGDYLPTDDGFFPGNSFKASNIRNIEANLGGPLLSDDLTFFANARYIYFNGSKKGFRRFNPWNSQSFDADGQLTYSIPDGKGDSAIVPMDWSERYYAQGKLTWRMSSIMKLSVNYIYDDRNAKAYDRNYYYNPDGKGTNYDLSNTLIFQFNHSISPSTFYTIGGSYFNKDFKYYLYDLKYKDTVTAEFGYYPIQIEIVDPNGPHYVDQGLLDATTNPNFKIGGTDLNRSHRTTQTGLIKFDLTSQIDGMNMIKLGVELRSHIIQNESMKLLPIPLNWPSNLDSTIESQRTYIRTMILNPIMPNHDYYKHKPTEFSAYIQDKMEYKNIIVNLGVRFDYFDPDGVVLADPTDPDIFNPQKVENQGKSYEELTSYWYKPASKKYAVSPRLGVSFPITDRGIVHFSYGHFFQLPRFERLYENPNFKFSSLSGNLGLIGNADLDPEETVSAEVGVQQQLSDDIALDITAFMRDIRGLAGTQGEDIETVNNDVYTKYSNSDFGLVKGIVLTLDKKFSSGLTARLDYTYQVASGTASDPAQARNAKASNAGMVPDIQMVPLDWDQRHTLNVSLNYAADVWGLSSIFQYGSGKPYTPQYVGASEAATSTTMVRNSQSKPSFFNCDLRAYYEIKFDPIKFVLFTRVFNLFDTRNQTDVYGSTGRSDYALEALTASGAFVNSVAQWYQDGNRFSEPRRIEFGMNLEF